MSSAIVHSYYFTEAGLLAFIEFHFLYNLLIEVLVQVPGVVVILCSMLTSVVYLCIVECIVMQIMACSKPIDESKDQLFCAKVLVSRPECQGLGLGLEFF